MNFKNNSRNFSLVALLATLISSCAKPAATQLATQPTSVEMPSTATAVSPMSGGVSYLEAGIRYSDAPGDMEVGVLDVVSFKAMVDESTESVEIRFQMRDVPPTAPLDLTTDLSEYLWVVFIYLNPATTTEVPGDNYFAVNTSAGAHPVFTTPGGSSATPGGMITIPINQLFENKSVYNSTGRSIGSLNVVADPNLDTITMTGQVPGITSSAGFGFTTSYLDILTDRHDNFVASPIGKPPSPTPSTSPSTEARDLVPASLVRAYPGPRHFEGDILTFEIQNNNGIPETEQTVRMQLDDGEPVEVTGTWSFFNEIIIPLAFDTKGLTGTHTLHFTTSDGNINEYYSFEVLPASERPAQEADATWLTLETPCCVLHYVSGTPAERDIDFIAEHFQKGADDFSEIMRAEITSKLDVYLIDRIWGNGGFGGGGQIVASYTDRYYGPTIDGAGLQTLARHELSHAAGIGIDKAGDGLDFNYEGLAVYVAGGHYKPEPLAKRGAAMFDLGYFPSRDQQFFGQHELDYLYPAVILTYIADTYGSDAVWDFLDADDDVPDDILVPLDEAVQKTFAIPYSQFREEFRAWLEKNEPGEQLEDLRLTIELQDLRRQYQDIYAPPPFIIFGAVKETILNPDLLPVIVREADSPGNVAFELIVVNAQKAIVDGNYPLAEEFIGIMESILDTGTFANPRARDYLDISHLLMGEGYNVDELIFTDDSHAQAQVVKDVFELQTIQLQKLSGKWEIGR